ncbi:hypothetical protein TNCV_4487541 [Trichonephila clavipes]|nr:hypothetical protein TNCV_4487541 [Trichonephila clavipes]
MPWETPGFRGTQFENHWFKFRSTCSVDGDAVRTLSLMYPRRKRTNGFRSRLPSRSFNTNYHTRIRVAGKVSPECTVGNVIPYATVRRRFGDIHSAGHSIANHHKKTPDRTSFNND